MSQELCASVAVRQAQHSRLMRRGVAVSRHDQFEDCGAAVIEGRLGDECLRCVGKWTANVDSPVSFYASHERRQGNKPALLAGSERLVANDDWDLDHAATLTGHGRVRARFPPGCR